MPNFFTDNSDIQFYFNNLDIREVVSIAENDFEDAKIFKPHQTVDVYGFPIECKNIQLRSY